VFIQDSLTSAMYAGIGFIPSTYEEMFIAGDDAGYMHSLFAGLGDGGGGIDFSYETKFFDFGSLGTSKRFHKIIVWTKELSLENLSLDWWVGYKAFETNYASMQLPMATNIGSALWDISLWDISVWEQGGQAYNPIVFNLNAGNGPTEGDCLKLRFRQSQANVPVVITGFTVVYSDAGLRK